MGTAETPDVIIIGSGMGGATVALALAPTGARILILDKGRQLPARPENRDPRAIFQRGFFRPKENWHDSAGKPFNPGNYYNHGGNSKFYGAVLARYRSQDFDGVAHADGDAPPWPFRYAELEPWYGLAERIFRVRGSIGEDPTEPAHSTPYDHPPIPDEPAIATVREKLKASGLHPAALPLGVDVAEWLKHGQTPWDAFPDARSGKMDAETCALLPALAHPNVEILSDAEVRRLIAEPDGKRIAAVEYEREGTTTRVSAPIIILAAGAVRSAVILLASGLANGSDTVGRHFMSHNLCALIAIDPRFVNDSVHQKTFGLNDFYLSDGRGGPPLGNIQLLGRVSGPILKANVPLVPEWVLGQVSRHAVDFLAMTEDLPSPDNRVRLDGGRITLDQTRTNMTALRGLSRRFTDCLRHVGFPIVRKMLFDNRTPSHQCGTIRIGNDPAKAALDPFGRAFDHPNLFVADASTLVTSAAVNPSLTVAALALRTADHIKTQELRA